MERKIYENYFCVRFNHDITDEPYKQTAIRQATNLLKKILGEHTLIELQSSRHDFNDSFCHEFERVTVEHSQSFTAEQKDELATVLLGFLQKKKGAAEEGTLLVFSKKDPSDFYFFLS